jgi:hypothetical protein
MPKSLIPRATVLLAAICLAASTPSATSAQQAQGQQQTADQQKKSSASAKPTAAKTPPAPAKDADKLTPERMSTRGLHKGNSDQGGKQDPKPKQDQQSTTKPDSQK